MDVTVVVLLEVVVEVADVVVVVCVAVVVVVADVVVVVVLHSYPFVDPEQKPVRSTLPSQTMLSHFLQAEGSNGLLTRFNPGCSKHIFHPELAIEVSDCHDMAPLSRVLPFKPIPLALYLVPSTKR